MLLGILRNVTIMRILLFLGLWYFLISPLMSSVYHRFVGCYTWMIP